MAERNLVTITVFGKRVTVHKALVPRLRAVEKVWQERGGHSAYRIDSIGGYADRNIANTNTKSHHASGIAIDINPSRNPVTYGHGSTKTDMPAWFIAAFKAAGFGWGGDWGEKKKNPKKDPMHFSLAPNEGGVGLDLEFDGASFDPTKAEAVYAGVASDKDFIVNDDHIREAYSRLLKREPTQAELSRYRGINLSAGAQDVAWVSQVEESVEATGLRISEGVQKLLDEFRNRGVPTS